VEAAGNYPIHIVVKNGRITLLGVVDNESDRTTAGIKALEVKVSVSNSWSGGDGELDEVPAVRHPAHIVQIGRNHRVLTGEGQQRVALQ